MSAYPHAHPPDSETDHRGVLNIVSWFLAISSGLIVLARLGTRYVVARTFELDDGLIVASMAFAVAQTAALSAAVTNGLGLIQDDFTTQQLEEQQKDIYVFNILFVVSQALVKSSIVVFIRILTPVDAHRRLCMGLLLSIIAWAVAAVFGLLFQCSPPNVWRFVGNHCIDRLTFYTAIQAINGALDVALIVVPTTITLALHLRRDRKVIIVFTFSARILVVAAIITQMVMLYQPDSKPDPFLTWYFVLSTQIVEYLSIISANGPYLRPFLESLSSGMIGNGDIKRRTGAGTQGITQSKLSHMFQSPRRGSAPLSPASPITSPRRMEKMTLRPGRSHYATAAGDIELQEGPRSPGWESDDFKHVIQQTRTFSVRSSTPPSLMA